MIKHIAMEKKGVVNLLKKPKGARIVVGFPGFGLVSTIAIGFLVDHLKCEQIGKHWFEEGTPTLAIHASKLMDPVGIYYNKKYNLVIMQSLTEVSGYEWELASTLLDVSRTLSAKEMIIVEGIPSHVQNEINLYYYSNKSKMKLTPLNEGIIMGTTAAILLKSRDSPVTCIFAEAHSQLPDSEAAAKVVEALNIYLKLNVDYKPLIEAAKKFERNLKDMIDKRRDAISRSTSQEKKELSYFG